MLSPSRIFTALALVVALSAQAEGAVAHVQTASDQTTPWVTDGTGEATFAAPCTPGNTIIVVLGVTANLTLSGTADGGGNTYAAAVNNVLSSGAATEIWTTYAPCTNAASLVTTTMSGASAAGGYMFIMEFSGLNNADPQEAINSAVFNTGTNNHNSGAVATTVADSLIVGNMYGSAGTYTIDDGGAYTTVHNADLGGAHANVVYRILTATEAAEEWNVTCVNEQSAMSIIAFNGTAAAGGASQSLMTLGVSP